MLKINLIVSILLLFSFNAFSVEPEYEDDLMFTILGWSQSGLMAVYVVELWDNDGYSPAFKIIDLVSDEIIYRESIQLDENRFSIKDNFTSQNLIREGYDRLLEKCDEFEITVKKYTYLEPNLYDWEYTFVPQIVINSTSQWIHDIPDYNPEMMKQNFLLGSRFIVYLLENGGMTETYLKAKYVTQSYNDKYTVSFKSKGLYMSPFGDRAVLIIVKEDTVGCKSYRFIGCSLLYGFEDTEEFRALAENLKVHR